MAPKPHTKLMIEPPLQLQSPDIDSTSVYINGASSCAWFPKSHRLCTELVALSLGVCFSVLHKSCTFYRRCAHGIQALSVGPRKRSLFMSFLRIDGSHTAQWLHCPTQNDPLVEYHQTCSPRHSPPQLASPSLSRCQDKTCKSSLTPHIGSINRLH